MKNGEVPDPEYLVKIKGAAGTYGVVSIDLVTKQVRVFRATQYEWIPFSKIKIIGGRSWPT